MGHGRSRWVADGPAGTARPGVLSPSSLAGEKLRPAGEIRRRRRPRTMGRVNRRSGSRSAGFFARVRRCGAYAVVHPPALPRIPPCPTSPAVTGLPPVPPGRLCARRPRHRTDRAHRPLEGQAKPGRVQLPPVARPEKEAEAGHDPGRLHRLRGRPGDRCGRVDRVLLRRDDAGVPGGAEGAGDAARARRERDGRRQQLLRPGPGEAEGRDWQW